MEPQPAVAIGIATILVLQRSLLGAPWPPVLLFEIVLALFLLFADATLRLVPGFERVVRTLLVTPDLPRTHNSIHPEERNSNYGNVLSLWDRLCRSYRREVRHPPRQMCIGLPEFRVPPRQTLRALLVQPLER